MKNCFDSDDLAGLASTLVRLNVLRADQASDLGDVLSVACPHDGAYQVTVHYQPADEVARLTLFHLDTDFLAQVAVGKGALPVYCSDIVDRFDQRSGWVKAWASSLRPGSRPTAYQIANLPAIAGWPMLV